MNPKEDADYRLKLAEGFLKEAEEDIALSMNKWNLLVCPGCRGRLVVETYKFDKKGDCREGLLTCKVCKQWHPVTNGISRLFIPRPLRPDDGLFSAWGNRITNRNMSHIYRAKEAKIGQSQVQKTFGYK